MKPAFVVTVHQSKKYRPNGHLLLERYIHSLKSFLKLNYDLFIMENASEEIFAFPNYAHYRYFPDQKKGMTRCWNEGVKAAIENGNDFICVTNEDIFFNETINSFFTSIQFHELLDTSVYGPVSDCPTTFPPQVASFPGEDLKDITGNRHPIHGWFTGFTSNYYHKFKRKDGNLFDPEKIWRGQEFFQTENWKKGARSFVVTPCLIHHDHLGSWKKTIEDIRQK